jgi:o-succinylbenzoate synthase
MPLRAIYTKQTFEFTFQARTSRGAMCNRTSWFIKLWDDQQPDIFGIGECAPLPGLSIDDVPGFEEILMHALQKLVSSKLPIGSSEYYLSGIVPIEFPSIIFGIETALLDLQHGGKQVIFENDFLKGNKLPINGLIWMGDMDQMLQQIAIKIYDGYRCIKMKVGSLNFEKECDILHYVRKKYYRDDVVIRLDANGAFKAEDCLLKLKELSKYTIHSIEQPIKPGQVELLRELSNDSPIPIALDEELIGVTTRSAKEKLIKDCNAPYIILKPTLHGGLQSCKEWIEVAEANKIQWWMTSALESNVGLNAISQFTAQYPVTLPQGLGTGQLYKNNIDSPLFVKDGMIGWDENAAWNFESLDFTQ